MHAALGVRRSAVGAQQRIGSLQRFFASVRHGSGAHNRDANISGDGKFRSVLSLPPSLLHGRWQTAAPSPCHPQEVDLVHPSLFGLRKKGPIQWRPLRREAYPNCNDFPKHGAIPL
jgi:hypothetical protein